MKSARCDNCGAGVAPGAAGCGYCGATFEGAAPAVTSAPVGANPEVLRLLREGKKIEAIKAYHEATKCGLKQAKDAVDAIEAKLPRGR